MKYKKLLKAISKEESSIPETTYKLYPEEKGENPLKAVLIFFGILIGAYLIAAVVFNTINAQFLRPVEEIKTPELDYKFFVSKKEVYRGEPIKMTLLVINKTNKEVYLYFASEKKYEFIVKKVYNLGLFKLYVDVWRSSYGKVYKNVPLKVVIKPHQVLEFSETWDQRLPNGKMAPPGHYIFMAKLYFTEGRSVTLHTGR